MRNLYAAAIIVIVFVIVAVVALAVHSGSLHWSKDGFSTTNGASLPGSGGHLIPAAAEAAVAAGRLSTAPHLVRSDEVSPPAAKFNWRAIIRAMPGGRDCQALKIKSQGACGTCWAHAATTTLSYRYWIRSGGRTNLDLSPTDLVARGASAAARSCSVGDLGCEWSAALSCQLGNLLGAWSVLNTAGVAVAGDGEYPLQCSTASGSQTPCSAFAIVGPPAVRSGRPYAVTQDHRAPTAAANINAMMSEIYANGPVTAGFHLVPGDIFEAWGPPPTGPFADRPSWLDNPEPADFGSPPVISTTPSRAAASTEGHIVVVVGWGHSGAVPASTAEWLDRGYWIVHNSWGSAWRNGLYNGLFFLRMGAAGGLEQNCYAAAPAGAS